MATPATDHLVPPQWYEAWDRVFHLMKERVDLTLAQFAAADATMNGPTEAEYLPRVTVPVGFLEELQNRGTVPGIADRVKAAPLLAQKDAEATLKDIYGGALARVGFLWPWALRHSHELSPALLGQLVTIQGVVRSMTEQKHVLVTGAWRCRRCTAVILRDGTDKPLDCDDAQDGCGRSTQFDLQKSHQGTSMITYREAVLVERITDLREGGVDRSPEGVKVLIEEDLVREIEPGVDYLVTGVYDNEEERGAVRKPGSYLPFVRVLGLEKRRRDLVITASDMEEIQRIAARPDVHEYVTRSIAPSLSEDMDDIRDWVSLALIEGCRRKMNGIMERGSIHLFWAGDPGIGKSQLSRWIVNLHPSRIGVAVCNLTSGPGLTAGVEKDPVLGSYALQFGTFVQFDGGLVFLDEFHDLKPDAVGKTKEPMEQQTVTISKIKGTQYPSRCGVIALLNPPNGRFDRSADIPIIEQVKDEKMAAVWDRFDAFFFSIDEPDPERDRRDVLRYLRSDADTGREVLDPVLCMKYHWYARTLHPVMTPETEYAVADAVADIRNGREGKLKGMSKRATGTIRRVAEALAKRELASTVEPRHVEAAKAKWRRMMEAAVSRSGAPNIGVMATGRDPAQEELVRAVLAHLRGKNGLTLDQLAADFPTVSRDRLAMHLKHLRQRGEVFENAEGAWFAQRRQS